MIKAAPIHKRRKHPAVAAALAMYDAATTTAKRHQALVQIARARAAQRIIDDIAAKWTAWRRDDE